MISGLGASGSPGALNCRLAGPVRPCCRFGRLRQNIGGTGDSEAVRCRFGRLRQDVGGTGDSGASVEEAILEFLGLHGLGASGSPGPLNSQIWLTFSNQLISNWK